MKGVIVTTPSCGDIKSQLAISDNQVRLPVMLHLIELLAMAYHIEIPK